MAFNNSNYGNNFNNNNNNGGEKKKTNFKVGPHIYGTDGMLDVSIWNSDKGGAYAIMSIKAAIGKDPSTGANAYEQKMSGELPSIFLNMEKLCAVLDFLKNVPAKEMNDTFDTGRGASVTFQGSDADVKITINNQKTGTRTITLTPTQSSPTHSSHACIKILTDLLEICYEFAKRAKLDDTITSKINEGNDMSAAIVPTNDEVPFN